MLIRIKNHNTIHNYNDIQLEIFHVIACQSSPFTYSEIFDTVTQHIRDKGAPAFLTSSTRLSDMVSKTLKYYVKKNKLRVLSGKFYSTALEKTDLSAEKIYLITSQVNLKKRNHKYTVY